MRDARTPRIPLRHRQQCRHRGFDQLYKYALNLQPLVGFTVLIFCAHVTFSSPRGTLGLFDLFLGFSDFTRVFNKLSSHNT